MSDSKETSQTGPSRGELWFRLAFSLAGLVMVVGVVALQGTSRGLGILEVIAIAGVFFGGSAVWTIYRLFQTR